jgi:hypothetical protein
MSQAAECELPPPSWRNPSVMLKSELKKYVLSSYNNSGHLTPRFKEGDRRRDGVAIVAWSMH